MWTISVEPNRFANLLNVFNSDKISLSVKAHILLRIEQDHNRFLGKDNKEKQPPEEFIITLEHVLELESICFKTVEDLITNRDLINQQGFSTIKWLIEVSENDTIIDMFQSYINSIIRIDYDLAMFISSLIGHGKGAGTFVYQIWNVDLKYMSNYFTIEDAVTRMTRFIQSDNFKNLNQTHKENIIAFLVFYEVKEEPYRESVTRPLIDKFAEKHGISLK